ncbi:MAG: hypothetical protein QHH26_04870 [Armatimonadota bacterium]|nr:hypothetical protein [Armatimonadota bacterium]
MMPAPKKVTTFAFLFVFTVCLFIGLSQCGLSELAKDPRLDQKVSVKVSGQPLNDFLANISRQTGVKLRTHANVGDLRLIVMAKDIQLGNLLDSVAQALHLQISRKGVEGQWEYVFYQDAKTAREANTLKKNAEQQLARQMALAVETLKLPEEEIQKKIKEDRIVAPFIDQKEFRMAVALYGWLDDAKKSRLWKNGTLPIKISELPADLRKRIISHFDENIKYREKSENIKLGDKLVAICFEAQDDPLGGRSLWLTLKGSNNNNMSLVLNPSPESGVDIAQNTDLFMITTEPDPVLGEVYKVVPKKPLEGRLAEKAKTQFPKSVVLPQALELMCDAEGINFVCDYFVPRYLTSMGVNEWIFVSGDSLAQLIEKVAGLFYCRWKMNGPTCILYGKEWYYDRDSNVPQSKIAHWMDVLKTSGRLGLKELIEIANLNDKQIKALRFMGVPYPPSLLDAVKPLKFAYTLNSEQWKLAESKQGLPSKKLSQLQKDRLVAWLESAMPPDRDPSKFFAPDAEGATVWIKKQGDDNVVFSVKTRDGRIRTDILKLK